MRRLLGTLIAAGGGLGGYALESHGWPSGSLWFGLLAGALIGWSITRCPHAGPLALLPATTDIAGAPLPPRWFCDVCSATWPANFERDKTPVKKFTGYDESKAVTSAKRAAELADRQQALAMQRAGQRRRKKPVVQDAEPSTVTPFRKVAGQ